MHILQFQTVSSCRRHLKTHPLLSLSAYPPPIVHSQCALRFWRYIIHSLVYLVTYLKTDGKNKWGKRWTDDIVDWCNKKYLHLVQTDGVQNQVDGASLWNVVDTNGQWAHGVGLREKHRSFEHGVGPIMLPQNADGPVLKWQDWVSYGKPP